MLSSGTDEVNEKNTRTKLQSSYSDELVGFKESQFFNNFFCFL